MLFPIVLSSILRRLLLLAIFLPALTWGHPLRAAAPPASHPDLYVVNLYTNDILHYDGMTGALNGSLSAPQSTLRGIAFGPDGLLYCANSSSGSILRFDPLTNAYKDIFVPNNGTVTIPESLAFGPDGNLYVGDGYASSVRCISGTTGASLSNVS